MSVGWEQRPRQRSALALGVLLAAAIACSPHPTRPGLDPVPQPTLEGMEEAVRAQLEGARERLERALADSTASDDVLAAAFAELGELYHVYDLGDAARIAYRNALRLQPLDTDHAYLLAVLEQSSGDLEEAQRLLAQVLATEPENHAALMRSGNVLLELDRADQAAERFAAAFTEGGDAAALLGWGRALRELGEPGAAIERFTQAIELAPEANAIHRQIARAYTDLGERERASEHLARQGVIEPPFFDRRLAAIQERAVGVGAMLRRGDAAILAGRADEAVARYSEAARAAPTSVEAWQSLAAAQARAGDATGARTSLERALELAPQSVAIRLNLTGLLLRLDEPTIALGVIEPTLELDPENAEPRVAYAAVLERLGRPEQALSQLERAAELDPTASARARLADALARAGHYVRAAPIYQALLEHAPEDLALRMRLSTALMLAGRDLESRRRLEDGLERDPANPQLRQALARLLANARDPAARDPERALALASALLTEEATIDRAETVAMALAAGGRFAEAASWQERLLAESGAALPAPTRAQMERNLERYRRGQTAE